MCSFRFLLFFTIVYCFCNVLLFFTVFYCFAIILLFFTVCVKSTHASLQSQLFDGVFCTIKNIYNLPHTNINHISRIHQKHDNTFCAVDFLGCPCKNPYNKAHDDQYDNINDILHKERDRADCCCDTEN